VVSRTRRASLFLPCAQQKGRSKSTKIKKKIILRICSNEMAALNETIVDIEQVIQ
jgi:hypothetical protein